MATQSLYRKYRSQTFGDLIGQDHVIRTLQNAIARGRIAHAYLFTGPRGTGKTSTARLLAKALCAEDGPTANPSDDDPICRAIAEGNFVDVVEMDAASDAGVDDVRERIVDVAEYRPMVARFKVFIIDEVHDLSNKAFDALLKTIEEPPDHLVFILATTEYHKVPPTIRSRCQKYEFHRASVADLVSRLKYVAEGEKIEIGAAALSAIARMADGGFRDALTLLEQAMLSTDGEITLEHVYDQLGLVAEEDTDRLLTALKGGDVATLMATLDEVTRRGRDPRSVLESCMYRLSELTRASYDVAPGQDATRDASLHALAATLGRDEVLRLRTQIAEAHKAIRDITLPRLWLEAELIRIAQTAGAPALASAPQRESRPAPAPIPVSAPPAPAPEPEAAAPTAAPAPDPAEDGLWRTVLESIPEKARVHRIKLAQSRLLRQEGDALVVELPRQTELDWFNDKPQRVGYLNEVASSVRGGPTTIEFTVAPREASPEEDGAVELPLEGKKLEALAREIFGVEPPKDDAA